MARKRGRPIGAKTIRYIHNDVKPSRCPCCGSSQRTKYNRLTRIKLEKPKMDPFGDYYNVIVSRPTQCTRCGRWRMDVEYAVDD